MAWNFNFCAPYLPNDPMINFHRKLQAGQIIILMFLYIVVHTYYRLWGPDPLQQKHQQNNSEEQENKKKKKNQEKSQDNNSQTKSEDDSDENKSVSIAERIKDHGDQNASYISFKHSTTGKSWNRNRKNNPVQKTQIVVIQNVNVRQVQNYFPIVFGHHAIAIGISIMYSPYAQQSIAAILYVFFTFLLLIANSKRYSKLTIGLWIFMALLNVFIMMSALLQVGQSNWDYINNLCFSQQYVALY